MDNQENINPGNEPVNNISSCTCGRPLGCSKLDSFNWLSHIPDAVSKFDIVEVKFKNTRKEYFQNANGLRLAQGDVVAVEASPGHDIGIVSLTGELVKLQLQKIGVNSDQHEFKKIYRKAKQVDMEKWYEATLLEESTMLSTRKIANDLKLDMKIGDVEYRGIKPKRYFIT